MRGVPPGDAVCYTETVVPFCMLCKTKALNKAKVMYVYEKINCMISFQYILLYILVILISLIVYIRMRFVQSPASTQIRGKKVLEEKKSENRIFINCSCVKTSLAGLICEA